MVGADTDSQPTVATEQTAEERVSDDDEKQKLERLVKFLMEQVHSVMTMTVMISIPLHDINNMIEYQ